jgi:uncharacterized protein
VLGEPLDICSIKPPTGFYRDGCRNTGIGSDAVCAVMTAELFDFSKSRGNDLFRRQYRNWAFWIVKPGDRWCLCALRGQEAFEGGQAPRVVLRATHDGALA